MSIVNFLPEIRIATLKSILSGYTPTNAGDLIKVVMAHFKPVLVQPLLSSTNLHQLEEHCDFSFVVAACIEEFFADSLFPQVVRKACHILLFSTQRRCYLYFVRRTDLAHF